MVTPSLSAGEPTSTFCPPPANGHTPPPAQEPNGHHRSSSGPTAATQLPLKDRVAIVSGGSGGIGSEITAHLASLGARLIIAYIGDPGPADRLLTAVNPADPKAKPRAVAVECDVTDPAQVKSLFDCAESTFGQPVHILVTAHGVQDPGYPALAETGSDQWDRAFNVNAKGAFLLCREAASRLVQGGGGRIVTMSSSTVGSIRPGSGAYSASKAAVEVMTKVLAKELRGTKITANAIAPGPVATALFYAGKSEERVKFAAALSPMERLGEPRDVAAVVGFLVSDGGEWVNGQVIRINGGYV